MNLPKKKLRLSRDTLRNLSPRSLGAAHGGYMIANESADSQCVQCPLWSADTKCDTTLTHGCPIKKYI